MTGESTSSGNGAGPYGKPIDTPSDGVRPADTRPAARWVPTRAGLLNVWRYADETFEFHRGRLLLRGPNGAGKSMALELLFPFLLDARLQPRRLSSASQSRGTLYERVMAGTPTSQRVGYLWAEFQSSGRDGTVETFTIGVRLRATSSTREVSRDWFTTSQRIGHDLRLLDASRTPLGIERLREALGTRGEVHASADAYRAAVRRTLFPGCSEDQYEAVINALLALRTERLSQHLTPPRLNEILTQSLPPLDEREITAIAEGFERLDRRRENIEQLEADLREVVSLAQRQRTYALRVTTGLAAEVRAAESERDAVTRREREAQQEIEAVAVEGRRLEERRQHVRQRIREVEAEIAGIQSLDAYREGGRLDALRRQADEADEAVAREKEAAGRRETALEQSERELVDARAQLEAVEGDEQRAWSRLETVARELGASAVLSSLREAEPDAAETEVEAWVQARRTGARDVHRAIAEVDEREVTRRHTERQVEEDRAELDGSIDLRAQAAAKVAAEQERFAAELQAWTGRSRFFHDATLRRTVAAARDPREAAAAIRESADAARTRLAEERSRLAGQVEALSDEEAAMAGERARLLAGGEVIPEASSWRRDRTGQPGAPFWRLVDFRDGVTAVVRDRVESALLATGMLDAWVAADGRVRLPVGDADLILDAAWPQAVGATLAEVLKPEPGVTIEPAVVERLLAQVALRDSALAVGEPAAIGRDGTFRLATLSGRGPDRVAAHIGEAAREQARARRIARLAERIAEVAGTRAAVEAEIHSVDDRFAALDAELSSAPRGEAVDNAVSELQGHEAVALDAERRLRAAEAKLREAEQAVESARARRALVASERALPADGEALRAVEQQLDALDRTAREWTNRLREAGTARREVHRAERLRGQAEEELRAARDALEQAERRHRELETRWRAIQETIGAEYREVLERLDRAEAERRERGAEAEQIETKRPELAARHAILQRTLEDAERERAAAETRRRQTHARFVAAVRAELAGDAGIEIEASSLTGPTSILEVARAVAARHGADGDPARLRDQVANAVYESDRRLAGRADLSFEADDEHGWWLLRASSEGMRKTIGQLRQALNDELERARSELLAEEQRLFDETLTGSVREHIAARIRLANELVDGINRQLAAIRTAAADVGVRLRWEVDPEHAELVAVRAARSLLLRDPADLSAGERQDLYTFLRARIDHVRADDERAGHWETRLLEALDYRRWHRFTLLLSHRDWEGFKPLTSALQARLSTGERSMALHLPMLASIAAHYDGMVPADGPPASPRLILLDELFVGVDSANRAQLFGMLVAWNLDAVLTSDHEWCAYPTLDGIAIHHVHADGSQTDTVTTSRFLWNGRARREAPVVAASS